MRAAINAFQGDEIAAPTTGADVQPEEPNRIVNCNDVLQLVPVFTGRPFPFTDPANWPWGQATILTSSIVTWQNEARRETGLVASIVAYFLCFLRPDRQ